MPVDFHLADDGAGCLNLPQPSMRTAISLLIFTLSATSAFCQQQHWVAPGYQPDITASDQKPYDPKDPMREINGRIFSLTWRDTNFVRFGGTVRQVVKDGVIIEGAFGGHYGEFLLVNFPYQVVEDQGIPETDAMTKTYLCAMPAGTYTYTTVMGASRTISKLDYGEIYVPPPPAPLTPEQIAAAKKAEAERIKKGNASVIKWLQDQAEQELPPL